MSNIVDHNRKLGEPPRGPADGGARRVSRRSFLKSASVLAAAAGLAGAAASCEAPGNAGQPLVVPASTPIPTTQQYPEVPYAPQTAPDPDVLRFFTPHEALTVDALTSRIMPGSTDDPGAHEAGVYVYIDNYLSFNSGKDSPTYSKPPFAVVYSGDSPPEQLTQSHFDLVFVKKKEADRYGTQTILSPAAIYRVGLAKVDDYAQSLFGKMFIDLSPDQQDQIVGDLADDRARGFTEPGAKEFFTTLRTDVVNGMFADPAYGGNRDMVGWRMIGYPGAQRAYTPEDILSEHFDRPPQDFHQLMPFRPGQPANPDVILPVSGFDQQPK